MKTFWRGLRRTSLLLLLLAGTSLAGAATIEMRLSVKVILHPVIGIRPTGITDTVIRESVTNANLWMARFSRGYRFRLDEIVDIGGPLDGGTNGPSQFFGLGNGEYPTNFHQIVNADARFLTRTNRVNLLVATEFQANGGGACPTIRNDGADETRMTCRIFFGTDPWTLCHELGHFFGLYHTFGGCECSDPSNAAGCSTMNGIVAGDDGIADTVPDRGGDCLTRDQLAQRQYNQNYASLSANLRVFVDNTFSNVMSYHDPARTNGVLTLLQLDRQGDIANGVRRPFVSGNTLFISAAGSDSVINPGLSSDSPRRTITGTTNRVTANDVMLLRHGSYSETMTLRTPVTLRAPAASTATIGQP